MIKTRDAITDDEAWILGKLSQENNAKHDSFRPEDFIVALDDNTDERLGFGCIQYHRNIADDTEYVEIANVVILDRATDEQGCLLLTKLAQKAKESGNQQVFSFPHKYHDLFKEVGFNKRSDSELPEVMVERVTEQAEVHDTVTPYSAQPKNVTFTIEEEDEFKKPEGTTQEEVDAIKEELNINDSTNTKYSI